MERRIRQRSVPSGWQSASRRHRRGPIPRRSPQQSLHASRSSPAIEIGSYAIAQPRRRSTTSARSSRALVATMLRTRCNHAVHAVATMLRMLLQPAHAVATMLRMLLQPAHAVATMLRMLLQPAHAVATMLRMLLGGADRVARAAAGRSADAGKNCSGVLLTLRCRAAQCQQRCAGRTRRPAGRPS